jgi:hypothetical protein
MIRWLKSSPWGWPLTVFLVLIFVVIAGVVLSLLFSGCASAQPRGEQGGSTNSVLYQENITLDDGRTIPCIIYNRTALQCDFTEGSFE